MGTTEIEKRIKVGKKFEVAHELGVELAPGVLGGLLPAVAARGAAPAAADGAVVAVVLSAVRLRGQPGGGGLHVAAPHDSLDSGRHAEIGRAHV